MVGNDISKYVPTTSTPHVKIEGYSWTEENGSDMTENYTGKVQDGRGYALTVSLSCDDGYYADFLVIDNVKVNGTATDYFTNPGFLKAFMHGTMWLYTWFTPEAAPGSNKADDAVNTGVSFMPTVWAFVCAASCVGIAAMICTRKKDPKGN